MTAHSKLIDKCWSLLNKVAHPAFFSTIQKLINGPLQKKSAPSIISVCDVIGESTKFIYYPAIATESLFIIFDIKYE